MKKTGIIALTAMLLTTMTLSAQMANVQGNKPTGKSFQKRELRQKFTPQQRADRMSKELYLTAEQTQKVKALFEREDAERERVRAERQQMMQEKRAENQNLMQQKRDEHQANLEQIIGKEKAEQWTKTQQAKMQKLREKRAYKMRNMNDSVPTKPMKRRGR